MAHHSKEEPERGTVGNAHRRDEPLRNWSMGSYNADTGRSHSSVAEYHGEAPLHGNYAGKCDPQIPTGFAAIDKRRSQDPRPVRTREFTKKVE